jgi:hypothetical protein
MPFQHYTIKYSSESIEDLSAIAKHYSEINLQLKVKLKESVLKAEADLLRNPFAFSKVNRRDFRRILLKNFPYKMIYRMEAIKFRFMQCCISPVPTAISGND